MAYSPGSRSRHAPRPILIIEDDAALRASLAEQIALDGSFIAVGAESALEVTTKLAETGVSYDMVLHRSVAWTQGSRQ